MESKKMVPVSMMWGREAGRFVSLLVVFCFVLNGLAFRIAMPDEGKAMLSDVLAAQSSVMRLCSLSTLPLKIVYSLMGAGDMAGAPITPSAPKKNPQSENHSSDCAITALSPRFVAVKNHVFDPLDTVHVCISVACSMVSADSRPNSVPRGAWHILFILTILCHILARGGIPASSLFLTRHFHARRASLAGFFYLQTHCLCSPPIYRRS